LFEEYSEQIFGYCLRQLRSRSEAEDAVQTTFLYVLRALRRGVVPECESAWLTTIARNVCRSQRRTLDRRGPLASELDLDTIALARPDGDEDELLMGLREALASIPERQRRALVLREWQGLPTREIASRLGLSPPATCALLTRARHSLAQALTALSSRPALSLDFGLLSLQLRSQFKVLLGGAAGKAAATVAVAAVAVGGVSAERALVGQHRTSQTPTPVGAVQDVHRGAPAALASTPEGAFGRVRVGTGPVRVTAGPKASTTVFPPAGRGNRGAKLGQDAPATPQPTGAAAREGPSSGDEPIDPVAGPWLPPVDPPPLPVDLPPLPEIEPPATVEPPSLPLPAPPDADLPTGDAPLPVA
jgi:RNA polymerase sigma-70 factor (ECF subfamily)